MNDEPNRPAGSGFFKDTFAKTTADRRNKLLAVAIEEFAARGYSATNINDIARRARVSIGAMYSYFASKEDLFLTVVDTAYQLLETALNDLDRQDGDLFDFVGRMLRAAREFALEYPQLNQIYLDLTTQALSSMSVRLSSKIEVVTARLYERVFARAKAEGAIRADVDDAVMAFLLDSLFVIYQFSFSSDYYKERMRIFLGDERLGDVEDVERRILSYLRRAFGA